MKTLSLILFFSVSFSVNSWASPKRIITLNPSLTEIIFALGKGSLIVGTIDASDYPQEANQITRVGSYGRPNIEKILSLEPDLVLTFREGIDHISASFKRVGITFEALNGRTLGDYPGLIQRLGRMLSAEVQAKALLEKWKRQWSSLPQDTSRRALLLQLEREPLIVAGSDTFLSEVILRCGFNNSFSHLKGYPQISLEALHDKKIDVIVVLIEKLTASIKNQIKKRWQDFALTRNKPVLFYDSHTLSRLGPRLPDEAKKFCQEISGAK